MTIREVVEAILSYHPFLFDYHGCDDYKCGDPDQECTGIVTAISPTIEVIRETIRLGANMIITHEPTYYTSEDGPGWFEDFPNSVYKEKAELLKKHGIVIWRDHDHLHFHQPDGIFEGVLRYTGWKPYAKAVRPPYGGFGHFLIELPETITVKQAADHLMNAIGMNGCRYVGRPEDPVKRILIVGHLYPMMSPSGPKRNDGKPKEYSVQIIGEMEEGVDLILPGETIDWTVLSYIRDAYQLGHPKAMISLGHYNWESLGMKYAADWVKDLVPAVPVTFVDAGDLFRYFVRKDEQ
ncbi:MAG: Nif3-like dinuclear metal center hexameric protein [Firmicutes bacterium]|nr:Nif3-like dinuclear metal center hexameric protein [Bacillota bacterium]